MSFARYTWKGEIDLPSLGFEILGLNVHGDKSLSIYFCCSCFSHSTRLIWPRVALSWISAANCFVIVALFFVLCFTLTYDSIGFLLCERFSV